MFIGKSRTRGCHLGRMVLTVLAISSSLAFAEQAAPPVKVDVVTEMVLPASAKLMGTLQSKTHIPVTAGVNGRLDWLPEPGSLVAEGQVLAKIDTLPLELRLAEQKAQIKRELINQKYLKNEVNRLSQLRKTNAASQFQLDQTRSQYDLASADLEIAKLRLEQIEDQLQRAVVRAPFTGVVTERLVRAGTDVSRGDELIRYLDTENLEAIVYVPVKYLSYLNRGNALKVSAEGQSLAANITAIIPSADMRSQTIEVRLLIPHSQNEIWASGQLVEVIIPIQAAKPSLTVHRDALILRKDGTYVVKVTTDSKVERLPVKVGTGTVERVSVVGELSHGDQVAIRGAERLEPGQEVIVQ